MTVGTNPLRILVVDDEPAIRRFLRTGLDRAGLHRVGGGRRRGRRWTAYSAMRSTWSCSTSACPTWTGSR